MAYKAASRSKNGDGGTFGLKEWAAASDGRNGNGMNSHDYDPCKRVR